MNKKKIAIIAFVGIVLLCLAFVALGLGSYPIHMGDVFGAIFGKSDTFVHHIIFEVRLPRVLAAIFVGGALATSGVIYQGIFTNPLVSPGILGVLSGASFGAGLGMILDFSEIGIGVFCFLFGFVAMGFSVLLAQIYSKGRGVLMLILGGIISSSFFGAGLSVIKFGADPYGKLPNIVYWLMGSLSGVRVGALEIAGIAGVIALVVAFILGRHLDILCLGDDEAKSLGVEVKKIRLGLIVLATILGTMSVVLGGIIGWVGLVIPHIGRFIVGPSHRYLLLFCAFFGGVFLLIIDTISRTCFETEIPIGILTSVVGIPIFVGVLFAYRLKE